MNRLDMCHCSGDRDDTSQRTGVWIANQKRRRDRVDADQLAALRVHWAQ
ncbi:hypothetical protein [Streptomyces sp. NPDC007369]